MADKLMYIPNANTQKYPFCRLQLVVERLDNQFNEPTNENSKTSPKLLSHRIRKHHNTLGTSAINRPMPLPPN